MKFNSKQKDRKQWLKLDPFKIVVVVALGVLFFNVNHMQKQKVEVNTTKDVAAQEQKSTIEKNELLVSATNFDYNNYVSIDEAKKLIGSYTLTSKQKLQWYPVGSIYMSTSPTNPASLFGGTWVAWGSGRAPVGINTSDGNFNTVEKTGGSATETLTVAQMPSHTHTFTGRAVTSGGNSVTPTASFTGKSVTSTGSSASLTASFTGKATNTGNNSASHNHRYGTGASSNAGAHNHNLSMYESGREAGGYGVWYGGTNMWWGRIMVNVAANINLYIGIAGNHAHTVAGTTAGINTNHTHSVTPAGTVSISNTTHTHSITPTGTVSIANTAHTHSVTGKGTNSNTGSGQAHSNLQPYITCYMWKRTA